MSESNPISIDDKSKKDIIILPKQLNPIYLMEIAVTFAGLIGSSVPNHILLELHYEPWIASVIVSLFYLGFLTSTLFFIKIAERHNFKHVVRYIFTAKLVSCMFYFIPIPSREYLILFGLVYFYDGTLNGMFWPLIQNISVAAEKIGGKKLKNGFLSRYNFSWNIGYSLGMVGGTIFLYFVPSNYLTFYLSFAVLLVGNGIAWIASRSVLQKIQDCRCLPNSLIPGDGNIEELKNTSAPNGVKKRIMISTRKLSLLPIYVILFVLLTHSLTDGAIPIILPLKISSIGQASYWIFFLGLIKLMFQTVSTTSLSNMQDEKIIKMLVFTLFILPIVWIVFVFNTELLVLAITLSISGFLQGSIYALGMRYMSYKARDQKQVTPFSRFQSMMSGGRLVGPLIIGFASGISLETGIWILIIYQIIAFTILVVKSRN